MMPDLETLSGERRRELNRRRFVMGLSSFGLGTTLMPGALAAVAQDAEVITPEMVSAAARIAGLDLGAGDQQEIAEQLNGRRSFLRDYEALREVDLGNHVQPSLVFNPVPPAMELPTGQVPIKRRRPEVKQPATGADLAFLPVTHLAELLRNRTVTPTDLTKLYLARLKQYDPVLHCVVTLTEELALEQASRADQELAAGNYRGPLHGIPYGLKDLFAVKGYRTTWGATPFKDRTIDVNSTVFERLTEAGAILVAKLTTGALAVGDRWFGGQTKSPWDPDNPRRGSSGSSAGPAAATAAGLVAFGIGTETRGSIISPASRCGVTGLRPTFGRVSRYGAMALSWSMDKVGPLCRQAEDCALVLDAIHGPDGKDNNLFDAAFNWDSTRPVAGLKVAYLRSLVEGEIPEDPRRPERAEQIRESRRLNRRALETIRSLGVEPTPVELPETIDRHLGFILTTEAAAAFDELSRGNLQPETAQTREPGSRPERFQRHRFVPAVEYLQANRARQLLVEQMHEFFEVWDLFIGSHLGVTNLTGHPELSLPHGFDSANQPGSFRLTGKLFGEAEILLLAHAFQQATGHHLRRPPGFA